MVPALALQSDFEQYIIDVKSRSVLDIPLEVAYGDRLLTLVTCHSGLEHGRLVIVCREVKTSDPVVNLFSADAGNAEIECD